MKKGQDKSLPVVLHCALSPGTKSNTLPIPLRHTRWQSMRGKTRKGCRAHLQAVANPPVEDSEVGVHGQQHSCEVHLLVDANDRDYLEVEGLQGG